MLAISYLNLIDFIERLKEIELHVLRGILSLPSCVLSSEHAITCEGKKNEFLTIAVVVNEFLKLVKLSKPLHTRREQHILSYHLIQVP